MSANFIDIATIWVHAGKGGNGSCLTEYDV